MQRLSGISPLRRMARGGLGILGALVISACTTTSYRTYQTPAPQQNALIREVVYQVDTELYASSPRCVVILPTNRNIDAEHADLIERALVRHLRDSIPRVIATDERRQLTRSLAVDLAEKQDRQAFARAVSCEAELSWHVLDAESQFLLFWSRRSIGLEVALIRSRDDVTLWKARHTASRSDGGLPLSPISAPISAYQAASLAGDADVTPSMVEDVVRRLFATLPDSGV